jgi:hypothetical protein
MSSHVATRNGKVYMVILPEDELTKKSVKSLLFIKHKLHRVLGIIGATYGRRCCTMCNEYIGDDWEGDVGIHLAAYREYLKTIKRVLETKPHVARPLPKPHSRADKTRKEFHVKKREAYFFERLGR